MRRSITRFPIASRAFVLGALLAFAPRGANAQNDCAASAGHITTDFGPICLQNGAATLVGVPAGNASVPDGYATTYLLTRTNALIIEQFAPTPTFTVHSVDVWRIHTLVYDPNTLDLGPWTAGTYAYDLQHLLVQGGGAICASLDISGAPLKTGECPTVCTAKAAGMTADMGPVCLVDGEATLTAAPMAPHQVPPGYEVTYLLTRTNALIIEQFSATPSFTVNSVDVWRIHALVYDPATLDLSAWTAGTYAYDLQALLVQGGGAICASLDISGAPMKTGICDQTCTADAGTLTASDFSCMPIHSTGALLSATADGNANVPPGYTSLYLLSVEEQGGIIAATNAWPEFVVGQSGHYTIHTLIYDPATLEVSTIEPGTTSITDLNALLIQGGGSICASLDMEGAMIAVAYCSFCTPGNDTTVTLCYTDPPVALFDLLGGDPCPGGMWLPPLPADTFDPAVDSAGSYYYFIQSGNDMLIATVIVNVVECPSSCTANAGTLSAEVAEVCLVDGLGLMAAAPNGDAVVPDGYEVAYVLTQGPDGVIRNIEPDPMFAWPFTGAYAIHAFVYDPNTFDITSDVQLDLSTLDDLNALLVQGGGSICAGLDLVGASFTIQECPPPCDAGGSVSVVVCFTDPPFVLYGALTGAPCPNGSWTAPDGQVVGGLFEPGIDPPGVYLYTVTYDNGTMDTATVTVDLVECPDEVQEMRVPAHLTGNSTATGIDAAGPGTQLGLWPNPAADAVRVRLPYTAGAGTRVDLFDATGRTVGASVRFTSDGLLLDVSPLAPGSWTLRVTNADQVLTGRFVRAAE
ncbi:MAG: T9SS type A sorting domain-containing protein [Bacteroidetes bacterium]|nr:T9SS type A sorting domain-containing protein [Bacteroidota bacterium]